MESKGIGQLFLLEMSELDVPLDAVLIQVRVTTSNELHLLLLSEVENLPSEWECDGTTYPIKTEIRTTKVKKK